MSQNFQVIQLVIDEEALKKTSNRTRNQLVGCMHAHNELAVLNRLLLFSLNDTGEGELHDSAHSIQMWCILQILAAKLFETWAMLSERFLNSKPEDPALVKLNAGHKISLNWLVDYFGVDPLKNSPLRIIRDKTGFHYDKVNLDAALENIEVGENTIFLAQHPANCLYHVGSSLVFRAVFANIADQTQVGTGRSHRERTKDGFHIALEDAKNVNVHMHDLLYGLLQNLLEEVLNCPVESLDQVRINVRDAPNPETIGLPAFIDVGGS